MFQFCISAPTALCVDDNGRYVVIENGVSILSSAVVALDASYGSNSIARKYPLGGIQKARAGKNAAVLLNFGSAGQFMPLGIILFIKPGGASLCVPALLGSGETVTPIGTMFEETYVGCGLLAETMDESGRWTAQLIAPIQSVSVAFLAE